MFPFAKSICRMVVTIERINVCWQGSHNTVARLLTRTRCRDGLFTIHPFISMKHTTLALIHASSFQYGHIIADVIGFETASRY